LHSPNSESCCMNFRFWSFLKDKLKKEKIGGVTFAVGDA